MRKPQRQFLLTLMTTIFVVCSKVNYTNLSRYSDLSERTYRRHFERGIGFEGLNQALIEPLRRDETVQIAVVDCTFVEKSGRHTYGLDQFYSGKTRRPERGLELSAVAIVDLEQKSGYKLSAQQTEAGLQQSGEASEQADGAKGNRIDFYLGHLAYCTTSFPTWIRYLVADGFYSKYKWVTGVVQLGFHAIGKLRCDANLKFRGLSPYCRRLVGQSQAQNPIGLSAQRASRSPQLCRPVFHRPRH